MKYAHIIAALYSDYWAILPDKLIAIDEVIHARLNGVDLLATLEPEQNHGGVAYCLAPEALSGQATAAVARREGKVAVLPVRGVMTHRAGTLQETSGGTSTERAGAELMKLARDESVKAIVLDMDTPGGSTLGLPEFASLVRAARDVKPVIAQVNAIGASAGYWTASQASEIVVTPSGAVGSIGVLAIHRDRSAAMEQLGIRETLISSAKYKTEGNPNGPLDDEARMEVQRQVDALHGQFIGAVAKGRGVPASTVSDRFGQGRMVDADEALARGMADRVGTMEQTLNRLGVSMYGAAPASRARAARDQRNAELRDLRIKQLTT